MLIIISKLNYFTQQGMNVNKGHRDARIEKVI